MACSHVELEAGLHKDEGHQNIAHTEGIHGGNTAPQSSRKPQLHSARSSRRLFPDSARRGPRRMTGQSLQERLKSGGLTLATSQSPMPGVGVIKETVRKKRSFNSDQRIPTETSASFTQRPIPNQVSDRTVPYTSERPLHIEAHVLYGARSFREGPPGLITEIPRLYQSKISEDSRAVSVPTDPHNQMSELRRNFETSSMPLPLEEPQSYATESDDVRLSVSNFDKQQQQEEESSARVAEEWRKQERTRLSSRFHFKRNRNKPASAISSFSEDLTTAANIPQQTGEDQDTREVRSLVVHEHSASQPQQSALLHRRVLSVLKEEDHYYNQSPDMSTAKKPAEQVRHQEPPTPSDALDSVRAPPELTSPSHLRVAYLAQRQAHAHSAGLMRRTEDKFFGRDDSRHDLLPTALSPRGFRGLCSLPSTPQRVKTLGCGVNALQLRNALRLNLAQHIQSQTDESGGDLVCDVAAETQEERIRVECRYCTRCQIEQPLRSKHCRKCGFCVATYDHHCPWLGNCVAEKSRCLFFYYTLSQFTTLLLGLSMSLINVLRPNAPLSTLAAGSIAVAISGVFSLFLLSLVGMHGFFAASNRTTWQCLSRKKISYMKIWPRRGSPFNLGLMKNLKLFCCYKLPRQHFLIWRYPHLTLKPSPSSQ